MSVSQYEYIPFNNLYYSAPNSNLIYDYLIVTNLST